MLLNEIHHHLKAKFGAKIAEWAQPEAGDPWIEVDPAAALEVLTHLRSHPELKMDYLRLVTGTDFPPEEIHVAYHLFSYEHKHDAAIKIRLDRAKPAVASVAGIWPSADWHERETYDLLGVTFEGHPDLKRILLPEDWVGYPLRKDYTQPDEYHGVSHW